MVRGSKRKSTSKRRQAQVIEEGATKRGTSSKRGTRVSSATVSNLEGSAKKGITGRRKKRSATSTRVSARKGNRKVSRARKSR